MKFFIRFFRSSLYFILRILKHTNFLGEHVPRPPRILALGHAYEPPDKNKTLNLWVSDWLKFISKVSLWKCKVPFSLGKTYICQSCLIIVCHLIIVCNYAHHALHNKNWHSGQIISRQYEQWKFTGECSRKRKRETVGVVLPKVTVL